jgi:tetratricopeptide (TPR) repeat protein
MAIRVGAFGALLFLLASGFIWAAQPDPAAVSAYESKDYKTAVQLLEQQVAKTPNEVDALVLLGSSYRQLGELAKSGEVLKKAYAQKPKEPSVLLEYGHTLLALKKFKEAEEIFQKGVSGGRRPDEFHNGLGLAQFGQGAGNKAEFSFRKAIQLNPNAAAYHKNLGDVNMASQIYSVAANEYKTALGFDSTNVGLHHVLARAHLFQKNYNDAIAELKTVLRMDSNFAEAYRDLGQLYIFSAKNASDTAQYRQAVWAYTKYTQFDPNNGKAFLDLARAHIALKETERAQEAARKALAADSTLCDAYFIDGQALQDTRKDSASSTAALEAFNRYAACLRSGNPDYVWTVRDYEFFFRRGRANRAMADSAHYVAALADFEKMRELVPTSALALAEIAQTQYALKNYAAAHDAFSRRLSIDSTSPNTGVIYLNDAYSLLQMERNAEAAEALKKALELKPEYQRGLSLPRAWGLLGETHIRLKDYQNALAAYNQVLEKDSTDTDALKFIGFVYLDGQKHAQAIPYLERAWKSVASKGIKPCSHTDLLTWMGQTYMGLKNNPRAKEFFQRCLDCEPGNKTCREGLDYLKGQLKGELSEGDAE